MPNPRAGGSAFTESLRQARIRIAETGPERKASPEHMAELLGRTVPTVDTDDGPRATSKGEPIDPKSVQRYLEGKFRENLADVRAAMEDLANSFEPDELADEAYALYERFRPSVPEGTRGWGAAGELHLDQIRSLARQ